MEKKLIYEKLPAIMAEVEAIEKGRKNQQQGYSFRGIDDIYNALHDIFAKHKVFITSEIVTALREDRETKAGNALIYSIIDFRFSFHAEDGSSVTTMQRGEAMDSGDKASNKAASVALKYALMQTLLIPTVDDKDPDTQAHEVKSKPQATANNLPPMSYTDAIKQEVENAINIEKLTGVWNKYPALKDDAAFKAAITARKLQLTP